MKAADIIKSDVGMYYFHVFSVTCSCFVCQRQCIVCRFSGHSGQGQGHQRGEGQSGVGGGAVACPQLFIEPVESHLSFLSLEPENV